MMFDVIDYTKDLIRFDTTNPPGEEAACGDFTARTLEDAGFHVERQTFGSNRMNVVATLAGSDADAEPLVLSGHLDTVPLGAAQWSYPPFAAEMADGRLYGRGASDMKSGVAAMIGAGLRLAALTGGRPRRGMTIILTSGEETGCAGALHLVREGAALLGRASAMIVGEPTANIVSTAHKGALFISAKTSGVTAHSSCPDRGVNAIYKASRAIAKIENYGFTDQAHPVLGSPTINVGMVSGGLNVNSVPDQASFTIDIRTNAMKEHQCFLDDLAACLGQDVELETFTDMPAISTPLDAPFTVLALSALREVLGNTTQGTPQGLPFFTDASVFHQHYHCPVLILGPGEPATMHETDEYCFVHRIEEAQEIYTIIAERWCGRSAPSSAVRERSGDGA
ncbi:M20 family metallopeptidase [Kineobactrum salinum]|uniref:Probable succinyl-diaminopimelate desuccinylase n=1 Tax=Kineobactrum salinum TaxID=2708301 RepID=A0A6C0U3M0_9GAMM|nr:M20 family metallopeptidase [Kineobactrum salinum]QIB64955.1 M20 family metallopeptidase [Kineobactrum salinum]